MFPDIRDYRNNVNAHYYRNKDIGSILVDGKLIEYKIPHKIEHILYIEERMIVITRNIHNEFLEFNESVSTHLITNNISIK